VVSTGCGAPPDVVAARDGAPLLSGLSFGSRRPPLGLQAPARHHTRGRSVTHRVPPRKDRNTAVTAKEPPAIWHPACAHPADLPRPLGQLLGPASPCGSVAFRGAQDRQARQSPQPTRPGTLAQHQTTAPPHPTGCDQMGMTRPPRIARDAFGVDFIAAPSLDRVIQSEDRRPVWGKARAQPPQQDVTRGQGRPTRTMQHPVRVDATLRLAPSHAPPARRHRAGARGENRAAPHHFGVCPDGRGKERRTLYKQGPQRGRQCPQRTDAFWRSRVPQLTWSAVAFSKTQNGHSRAEVSCAVVFEPQEWYTLYTMPHHCHPPPTPPPLREMVRSLAQLGGFLARTRDGEPGIKAIWQGDQRLHEFIDAVDTSLTVNVVERSMR
jgi:Transposase Tn5 dimerisation domain